MIDPKIKPWHVCDKEMERERESEGRKGGRSTLVERGGEVYDVGRRREEGGREGNRVVRVGESHRASKVSSDRVSYKRAIGCGDSGRKL